MLQIYSQLEQIKSQSSVRNSINVSSTWNKSTEVLINKRMNEYNVDTHVSVFGKKLRRTSSSYTKYVSQCNTSKWLRNVAIKRIINEWIYRYGRATLVILQHTPHPHISLKFPFVL